MKQLSRLERHTRSALAAAARRRAGERIFGHPEYEQLRGAPWARLRDGCIAAVAVAAVLFALLLIASEGQPRRAFGVTEVVHGAR